MGRLADEGPCGSGVGPGNGVEAVNELASPAAGISMSRPCTAGTANVVVAKARMRPAMDDLCIVEGEVT